MLDMLGHLALFALLALMVDALPLWLIYRYAVEAERKYARGYVWGLCAWSLGVGLIGLVSSSGKSILVVLAAWAIWFWADLVKTRA
jgi:hypothetical protein